MRASHRFYFSHAKKTGIAASILFGLLGAPMAVPANAASPKICPMFIAKYCVYNSSKQIFTASTNPCLARLRHWTVIYAGQCRFKR